MEKPQHHIRGVVVEEAARKAASSVSRTVTVVASTGAPVKRTRMAGYETRVVLEDLEVSERAVNLERLNLGAPVLESHDAGSTRNQVGVVERAWLQGGKLMASIRFPSEGVDEAADRMFALVSEGIVRNISVGYSVERVKVTAATKDEPERITATRWTPLEISFVTVPADPHAQVVSKPSAAAARIRMRQAMLDAS